MVGNSVSSFVYNLMKSIVTKIEIFSERETIGPAGEKHISTIIEHSYHANSCTLQ
jgi:hypothetical protein